VFESGSILVYLAEKFGAFLPREPAARTETLTWLFWQMGSAPFLGGGFGHFFAYAPTKMEYPINRYAMEAKRQLDVLNRRLADNEYIAGADYSIADIAIWPWYGGIALGRSYEGADVFLATHEYEHLMRWAKQVDARPAVKRGRIVNKLSGDPAEQLHERHDASDFALRTQDKLQPVDERRDFGIGIDGHEAAGELVAFADSDWPGVILRAVVTSLEQFLEHDRRFLAVGGRQRIELQRVLSDRQVLLVRRAGDRPIDVGELAAARAFPGPHLRRHIVGAVCHLGLSVA
jgi:hypothetical protein